MILNLISITTLANNDLGCKYVFKNDFYNSSFCSQESKKFWVLAPCHLNGKLCYLDTELKTENKYKTYCQKSDVIGLNKTLHMYQDQIDLAYLSTTIENADYSKAEAYFAQLKEEKPSSIDQIYNQIYEALNLTKREQSTTGIGMIMKKNFKPDRTLSGLHSYKITRNGMSTITDSKQTKFIDEFKKKYPRCH